MSAAYRFCPQCAAPLAMVAADEDGERRERLRCTAACGFTHWNNPTPVLAAVIECVDRDGRLLLARNAAWADRRFRLVTGFMEAGESPQDGVLREVTEETGLHGETPTLIGVYDFQRMNQVIIAYHVPARGAIRLSPELLEYELVPPPHVRCWPAATGLALADWLRSRGHEPRFIDAPSRP